MNSKLGPLMETLVSGATRLTGRGSLMGAAAAIQRAIGDAMARTETPVRADDDRANAPNVPANGKGSGGAGRFVESSFTLGADLRSYKLFTPAGFEGQTLPLVLMLHGCTQDPDDFAAGTRMNALAQAQGFLVLYPAQQTRSNASKCWNWFQPGDQRRGDGEPALLAGLTRHIMASAAVDPDRVYVAGLSAGGAMAAILAAEYPDLYAAAGVHSGLPSGAARDLGSALAAMKNGAADAPRPVSIVPTIVFHGDDDATVHPNNGEQLIRDMRPASMAASSKASSSAPDGHRSHGFTRTVHRDATGASVAEHWRIHGAGHAWSGGSPAGSYTDAGGPDASREMLRFFVEHPRAEA